MCIVIICRDHMIIICRDHMIIICRDHMIIICRDHMIIICSFTIRGEYPMILKIMSAVCIFRGT